ncbi:alpha-L-fucosidase [Pararhodonellum marinum]|uniref:alpha-L-fucosidase n=1 Tax=Pararhodonellum marinum TaxID=2755358 RepID=UPI001890AE43|nr:alpha-L-fucosidase [Pararhodonellum marinum]
MKNIRLVFIYSVFMVSNVLNAQDLRTDWWTDARFGMFIHWGLYSGAEGMWKGEKHRHFNNYAEWIKYRNRISTEAYGKLAERFLWDDIDPEEWVILAKKAGMHYITITAKHHDGFALWDTQVGEYSFKQYDPESKDVIAELAAACKKHGIKLGFYYSHWVDWEHPFGWDHNRELSDDLSAEEFDQYWQEKVMPQLRELLTNYGEIAMLWFDMWIPHQETIVEEHQVRQVISLVRELQPDCLINSRLGLPVSDPDIDFETLGDNQLGAIYQTNPWQTPGTIAHSWGYNALENEWKSTNQLLQALINNVSLNGNFMLNIGPRADGSVPFESISRLKDMGQWLATNGEAIYQAGGIALRPTQHDWGKITYKSEGERKKLYLQVFNWPLDKILRVTGITATPKSAYLLADKLKTNLSFDQKGPFLHIDLPRIQPDPFVSVVVLEFGEDLNLDREVAAESSFGGVSLHARNLLSHKAEKVKADRVTPEHLLLKEAEVLEWKFYVDAPGEKQMSLSYANPGIKDIDFQLEIKGLETITKSLPPTGKVVVEPNQQFYAEEFVDTPLGKVNIPEPGYYTVLFQLKTRSRESLKLNWIWVE